MTLPSAVPQPESARKRRLRVRYVVNLIIAGVIAFFATIFLFGFWQGAVNSDQYFLEARIKLCCTPAKLGLEYEDAEFKTDDGLTLRGWYLPSRNGSAILVAHGFNQTRENPFDIAVMLQNHGYGVLAFDMRGHGESDGKLLVDLYRDGLAAAQYLKTRPDVQHVGAYGFSLGGEMVLQAAALTDQIEAVVTDGASFTEYEDMPVSASLIEWLFAGYDFAFFRITQPRFGSYGPVSTLKAAAKIAPRPQLYIASDTDWRMVQRFYEAAGEPKTFWYIQGVNHGEGSSLHHDEYEEKLIAFYDAVFGQQE